MNIINKSHIKHKKSGRYLTVQEGSSKPMLLSFFGGYRQEWIIKPLKFDDSVANSISIYNELLNKYLTCDYESEKNNIDGYGMYNTKMDDYPVNKSGAFVQALPQNDDGRSFYFQNIVRFSDSLTIEPLIGNLTRYYGNNELIIFLDYEAASEDECIWVIESAEKGSK